MAYSFKKKENIGNKSTEYSRYYSAFRGVDFSSDHTQVHESRLAYLVNMYKDYQSGQGEALETVAGFRRRAKFNDSEVFGIFYFKCELNGKETERVLVHSGKGLYLWHNYPYSINISTTTTIVAQEPNNTTRVVETDIKTYTQRLGFPCEGIISLKSESGKDITANATYDKATNTLTFTSSVVEQGEMLELSYYEGVSLSTDTLFEDMNERKSASFICNNRLYIIDGKNYLVFDGTSIAHVKDNAYIPTTYINIIPSGENADKGIEYEQRNILTPLFKHTFIADGETKTFALNESNLDENVPIKVKVYGKELAEEEIDDIDYTNGKVTLKDAPPAPTDTVRIVVKENGEDVTYERGYAGVEITASKMYTSIDGVTSVTDYAELITNCTLCTTFDGRVFCSGNPNYRNYLFYCSRNSTGYVDPSYFGVLNYVQDGVGLSPITGLMGVSNTLMVLKSDTQQDSAIYFHTGEDTGSHILPRIYPSAQGLSGLGCVGACRNFLDDPIFISRLGVEGVSQLKIASERSNEHRSKLVDAKLVNTDLSQACLEEWDGYLCVLVDGKIFLADSRQRYSDATGIMQYEWYYLENIGVWDDQYLEYTYSSSIASELAKVKITHDGQEYPIELAEKVYNPLLFETYDLRDSVANPPDETGKSKQSFYEQEVSVKVDELTTFNIQVIYTIYDVKMSEEIIEKHAYLCETKGNFTGGKFRKATMLCNMPDGKNHKENLFFGCENGVVCSFNFDQRDENGNMPTNAYHFDNRTILCGCATLMDNCQIPHLTKSTIKRSTVIKTRSFSKSAAKIKVRTNKKPYEQIARINSNVFSFEDVDFSDFSFITTDQSLFAIKEKEKQWVEKQYYIYSDEYKKPFSLYYISYRYRVAGRYKN